MPRVVELVNEAFQVERPFKNGDRTNAEQVTAMLAHGRFLLMEDGGNADACVYLELSASGAITSVFDYSNPGNGYYQVVAIVEKL